MQKNERQSSDIFAKDVSLHNLKSKSQVLVITEHRPLEKLQSFYVFEALQIDASAAVHGVHLRR